MARGNYDKEKKISWTRAKCADGADGRIAPPAPAADASAKEPASRAGRKRDGKTSGDERVEHLVCLLDAEQA